MPEGPAWDRVLEVFEQAIELPDGERDTWVAKACGSDLQLATEVRHLLSAHFASEGILERSMESVAIEALDSASMEHTQIGQFRIVGELGRGGMGVVYRADDTRLGRQVALKVLPRFFASETHRLARFEREAQMLASLNHPNIAALYGLEESGETHALVMELVEGPTLAEILAKGPMDLEEALPIACQIAEALEAAHEKGIIHRDLKPANVKIAPGGTAKVLDFGLAKALHEEEGPEHGPRQSPTLTLESTPAGILLGTAGYMSPQQARGRGVDKRSDIWAFGVVLYEMLTGKFAYPGDTVSDTLAAILRAEPDWSALPANTPSAVRRLMARCLDKDHRRRLRDIGEARVVLQDVIDGVDSEPSAQAPAPAATSPRRRPSRLVWTGWVAAALLLVVAVAGWMRGTHRSASPAVRKVELPVAERVSRPRISPDGRRVAYLSDDRVWIRDLDRFEARAVPGSEEAAFVFWSPDSQTIGFGARDRLWRAPAAGGGGTVVCPVPGGFYEQSGAAWLQGDNICFNTGSSGLLSVSASGGDSSEILAPDATQEIDFHAPSPLPGSRGIVFVVHRFPATDTLAVLQDGRRKDILRIEGQTLDVPWYSRSGHIVYERRTGNPGVWAVPFNLARLEVTGEPFLVLAEAESPSLATDGTLALVRKESRRLRELVWTGTDGREIETLDEPREFQRFFDISPDEERIAVSINETGNRDIWVYDLQRNSRSRFTATPLAEAAPSWGVGAEQIVFWSGPDIKVASADGTGEPRTLAQGRYPSITPDGKYLVYAAPGEYSAYYDLWYRPLDESREAERVVVSRSRKNWPRVSPNGEWMVYCSDESGEYQVYLTRFPSGDGKWQVSASGGYWPRWSKDGRHVYFTDADRAIVEVEITTTPTVTLSVPQVLFERSARFATSFDLAPSGDRFLMLRNVGAPGSPTGITLIENWAAEFPDSVHR